MKSSRITTIQLLVGAACLAVFGLGTAHAQDETDRECAAACSASFKECGSIAREGFAQCREAEGCLEARATAKEICRADEVDEVACEEAKTITRECFAVCREPLKAEFALCRSDGETCLVDGCGLELRRPARALRSGRLGRRGGRGGGRG